MSVPVLATPQARDDIAAGRRYFESRQAGLGTQFVREVRATFDPGITWAGWPVPTLVEVAVVVVTCLVLLGLAVARFARTE